jgi:hypothetical protein
MRKHAQEVGVREVGRESGDCSGRSVRGGVDPLQVYRDDLRATGAVARVHQHLAV